MDAVNAGGLEEAFPFVCEGDELVGYLHHGDARARTGILALVPGGPQYRVGVGRQLLRMARRFADSGVPVMRFDQRGIGDSEGEFRGFPTLGEDMASAIAEFRRRVPGLEGIVLWGGCDAATAALIHAWRLEDVVGVVAGNPFVKSAATEKAVRRRHYRSRLTDPSFWRRVASLEYNPLHYLRARRPGRAGATSSGGGSSREPRHGDYIPLLLEGLERFQGQILFLMANRFLLSDHFDALVGSSSRWRAALDKPGYRRIAIDSGDQLFTARQAQDEIFRVAGDWLEASFGESGRRIAS